MVKFAFLALMIFSVPASAVECVILLHGLARTSSSMDNMQESLQQSGFEVSNIDYPSRKHPIETLAKLAVGEGLSECSKFHTDKIHFVTHSLGGILVRQYLHNSDISGLGRVVMLGPPNKGSEVVDKLGEVPGFKFVNGPAGLQLGTGSNSVPKSLGAADFDVGIIAGTRSINLILSMLIPSDDDGKVSLDSAHLENESDFMEVPVSHPFLMKDEAVIDSVILFLKTGSFDKVKL